MEDDIFEWLSENYYDKTITEEELQQTIAKPASLAHEYLSSLSAYDLEYDMKTACRRLLVQIARERKHE